MWRELAAIYACILVSLGHTYILLESLAVWLLIHSVYHLYSVVKHAGDLHGPYRY